MSQNKQNTLVSKPGNLSNLVRAAESSNQPSPNSTCSFLVDLADIQSMKQNLQELLTSFRSNKLQSFGENDTIQQMENIRTMQGRLARLHFGLDREVEYDGMEDSPSSLAMHDDNMTNLLSNLENLSTAIKSLKSQPSPQSKPELS